MSVLRFRCTSCKKRTDRSGSVKFRFPMLDAEGNIRRHKDQHGLCELCALKQIHNAGYLPSWETGDVNGTQVTRIRLQQDTYTNTGYAWGISVPLDYKPYIKSKTFCKRRIELIDRAKEAHVDPSVSDDYYQVKLALMSLLNDPNRRASVEEFAYEYALVISAANEMEWSFLKKPISVELKVTAAVPNVFTTLYNDTVQLTEVSLGISSRGYGDTL